MILLNVTFSEGSLIMFYLFFDESVHDTLIIQ